MPKKIVRIAYAMNYFMNAIFSLLVPAALLIGGGWLLHHRCGLGRWVMITAIILGVVAGIYSFFSYLLKTARTVDKIPGEGEEDRDR